MTVKLFTIQVLSFAEQKILRQITITVGVRLSFQPLIVPFALYRFTFFESSKKHNAKNFINYIVTNL